MRPKIDDKDKRNIQLKVYVTAEEKRKILKAFHSERICSLSEFVRQRLLKKRHKKLIELSEDFVFVFRTLDYDLTKIGTNVNQVAQKLNAYNSYMLSTEDKEVFKGCFRLLRECRKALEKHLMVMDM